MEYCNHAKHIFSVLFIATVWSIIQQFAEIRSTLDYTYHSNYAFERQRLQDEIISSMLHSASIVDVNGDTCTTPTEPWLVFTAGAMGAGKGHTIRNLVERKLLPLQGFVVVDPDEVRQFLPEYKIYIKENPMMAGELTRKEAGFICEILTQAALQSGKNVLVDGSLRDSDWYIQYFAQLRADYPVLRLAILHVTAPREAVLERAQKRGEMTGRKIPIATLEMAMDQVPKAVQHLSPLSDYFCELDNSPGAENVVITTPGVTNESFQENWLQMCLWVPGKPRATRSIEAVENILEQRRTLNRLSFSKRGSQILQQKISDMLKSVDFHLYDD
uniref:Zeta toxin domain-containing protein n=1 Tax=Corethron hystrix TaxID=216773 RepID=A0A7S1BFA9_9STRA|mmetsp:Transcript_24346/g.55531  ORF Transcript_24346/g.55531 Transcript_24346/m.55531 type:complete len:330 (+) Transcript_24346:731-1720(+)